MSRKQPNEEDNLLLALSSLSTLNFPRTYIPSKELRMEVAVRNFKEYCNRSTKQITGDITFYDNCQITLKSLLCDEAASDYPSLKSVAPKHRNDLNAFVTEAIKPGNNYYFTSVDVPTVMVPQLNHILNVAAQTIFQQTMQIIPSQGIFSPSIISQTGNTSIAGFIKLKKGTILACHTENGYGGAINYSLCGTQLWIIIHQSSHDVVVDYWKKKTPHLSPFQDGNFVFTLSQLRKNNIKFDVVLQPPGTVVLVRAKEWHYVVTLTDNVINIATSYDDGFDLWTEPGLPLGGMKSSKFNFSQTLDLLYEQYAQRHAVKASSLTLPVAYICWKLYTQQKDPYAAKQVGRYFVNFIAKEMDLILTILELHLPYTELLQPYIPQKCEAQKEGCIVVCNFIYVVVSGKGSFCAACTPKVSKYTQIFLTTSYADITELINFMAATNIEDLEPEEGLKEGISEGTKGEIEEGLEERLEEELEEGKQVKRKVEDEDVMQQIKKVKETVKKMDEIQEGDSDE